MASQKALTLSYRLLGLLLAVKPRNMTTDTIAPHGGKLIDRIAKGAEKAEFLGKIDSLPRVRLDERATSDLVMIAIGGFSPIKGFMEIEDYESVVDDMRLANGLPGRFR